MIESALIHRPLLIGISKDNHKMDIKSIVRCYLSEFADEYGRLESLLELIDKSTDESIRSRYNWSGHVTASGFIVSACRSKVLLLQHEKIGKKLQPGGHMELQDRTPLDTAFREIEEETGCTAIDYLAYHFNDFIPIDIDSHLIEQKGNEPAHTHHDFRYVFLSSPETELTVNASDFSSPQWCDLSELLANETYTHLKAKLEHMLGTEFRTKIFFERVLDYIELGENKFNAIAVAHLLPDVKTYLRTLGKVTSLLQVLPKPKSINKEVLTEIEGRFTVLWSDRESLLSDNCIANFLSSSEGPVILFDIGGYFAPIIKALRNQFGEKIAGVIEDTENGHQKYYKQQPLNLPVVSVARSPLKDNEDYLVGQSVLFSADSLLRERGRLIQYLCCSIFGFGKIGSSIASHLLARGVKPNVFDIDPIRRLSAVNRLCRAMSKDEIIRSSDVIFCATGNQVLHLGDFRKLKPGCTIFSVTSSDDEINLDGIRDEFQVDDQDPHMVLYKSPQTHFFLANGGNAVNFIHNAALGDFIHLVRAEMMVASKMILSGQVQESEEVVVLDSHIQAQLADLWLKVYIDEPAQALSLRG